MTKINWNDYRPAGKECSPCNCVEALIKTAQEFQTEINNARIGSFGFTIRKEETLQEGMARNYNEFNEERDRLQERLKTSQKLLSNLEFRKDYEIENNKLKRLLQDFYDVEVLLYQDSCCSDCDSEQHTIIDKIRKEVREFLKALKMP